MRVLSQFAGIGAADLGLERAGHQVVRQIERDPDCQRILRKNFPGVRLDDDVTTATYEEGEADVIVSTFPCQDISQMGPRTGLAGGRSGLFRETVRAYRLVRPRYLVLENVAALLRRGMQTLLGTMAAFGCDAEWDCIPASHVGAPHLRDRVWALFYPEHTHPLRAGLHPTPFHLVGSPELRDEQVGITGPMGAPLAAALARVGPAGGRAWDAEPQLPRVADGSPADVAAVKQAGNALVPRIAEAIGIALFQNAATVGDAPAEGPARRAAQDDPNLPPMEGGS